MTQCEPVHGAVPQVLHDLPGHSEVAQMLKEASQEEGKLERGERHREKRDRDRISSRLPANAELICEHFYGT